MDYLKLAVYLEARKILEDDTIACYGLCNFLHLALDRVLGPRWDSTSELDFDDLFPEFYGVSMVSFGFILRIPRHT